jgi:anti-sigma factor RsiW
MSADTQSLSCQELVELVTDYLEGALGPADLARFEGHIAVCQACATYLEQLRQVVRVTGTLTADDLSGDAERELLQAFRGWRDAS